ncbi:gamma-glutamylcyclotransferase [Devosia sp. A8/3-2]|nr:gamma-glutamylcyclotransferase [Devosia sp. A8/3-2]
MRLATSDDYNATINALLGTEPHTGEVWFFAYGSLIWKPACDFVEMRTGVVRGWHRAFCPGWNNRFRGSDENPGLMLALDRGGACKGVLYRLPADRIDENLTKLLEREMGWLPSAFPRAGSMCKAASARSAPSPSALTAIRGATFPASPSKPLPMCWPRRSAIVAPWPNISSPRCGIWKIWAFTTPISGSCKTRSPSGSRPLMR